MATTVNRPRLRSDEAVRTLEHCRMVADSGQTQDNIVSSHGQSRYIYSFDLARLIAALAVVLFHWGDFIVSGMPRPFALFLYPFYDFGAFAVPLFFSLSGFIFTWLYSEALYLRKFDLFKFFSLRLARLYPLYITTFVIAALIIPICRSTSYYTYTSLNTDTYHAILNIFMLSGWGFEHGFSFNGPSWSVSTEMFLYGTFAIVARQTRLGPGIALAMILVGVAMTPFSVHLGGGLAQFFAGSIAYRCLQHWSGQRRARWILLSAVAATVSLIVYVWEFRQEVGLAFMETIAPDASNLTTRYQIIRDLIFPTIFFPLILFVLAAWETRHLMRSGFRRSLVRWGGDISYAIYLCHFPLMMIFAAVIGISGLSPLAFYNPVTLVVYLIVLIGVAHVSFVGLERPAMRLIRSRLRTAGPVPAHAL